jgi:hypothetical protein
MPSIIPLPHTATTQSAPGLGHWNPGSIWQSSSQPSIPSPSPSSHCSCASTAESPHTVARQGVPAVMHTKPGSVRHRKLQPSPEMRPPSSQVSAPARMPSPHSAATHTSNEQSQPGSI